MVWGRVLFIGLKGEIKEEFEKESNCLEWATRKGMRWMEDLENESNCLEWATRKGRGGWTNGEGSPRLERIAKGLGLVFWIMGQV